MTISRDQLQAGDETSQPFRSPTKAHERGPEHKISRGRLPIRQRSRNPCASRQINEHSKRGKLHLFPMLPARVCRPVANCGLKKSLALCIVKLVQHEQRAGSLKF